MFHCNIATCLMQNIIQINVQQVTGIVYLLYLYIRVKTYCAYTIGSLYSEALLIQMNFQEPWKQDIAYM
jgi:hypothetical protein